MRALVALLLIAAPVAAESKYDDLAVFKADVDRAFIQIGKAANLPNVALLFSDTDSEVWCRGGGAAQLQAGYGLDLTVDTLFVCAKLRNLTQNYEQLYFVIGHEFGHFHHRFQEKVYAKAQELLEAYKAANPPPLPTQVSEMMAWNARGKAVVTAQVGLFIEEQEKLADDFSVGLMRRAGFHPGHAVLVLKRGEAFEAPSIDLSRIVQERTNRILERLPKNLLRTLPKDPFDRK